MSVAFPSHRWHRRPGDRVAAASLAWDALFFRFSSESKQAGSALSGGTRVFQPSKPIPSFLAVAIAASLIWFFGGSVRGLWGGGAWFGGAVVCMATPAIWSPALTSVGSLYSASLRFYPTDQPLTSCSLSAFSFFNFYAFPISRSC